MKKILSIVLILCMVLCFVSCGDKQVEPQTEWPTQPIQCIVSFGAGGDTDILCRKLVEVMQEELGQPIVCTNVTGSSGTVAARQVKDAANDGYTVLWHQSSFFVASATGIADFDYTAFELAGVAVEEVSDCLMVRKDAYKDFNDFVEKAKANPGKLAYGTSLGGYSHMQALAVADAFGCEFNIVDIGGGSETIAALIAGDIDFVITTSNYARTYTESGDCEVLCVVANDRCDATPDWPAISEFGAEIDITKIFGFYMPKGTDEAIVNKWNAALKNALESDAYKAVCEQYAVTPAYCDGKDALKLHEEQLECAKKYAKLMIK